jgi:hypothetical protein
MKRLVIKTRLGFPVPLAAMLPPIATAETPAGSAAHSEKPTPAPRWTVTVAGYYRIAVSRSPC